MPTNVGNVALFCAEAPECWFYDVLRIEMESKVLAVPIDPRFVQVCEPESMVVQCVTPEHNVPWRAAIVHPDGGVPVLDLWAEMPVCMVVTIAGIRKGWKGIRFPYRTERQRVLNIQRWDHLSARAEHNEEVLA